MCLVAIGMSGTGKTTFVNVLFVVAQKFSQTFKNVHCINLDPAVKSIPYLPFIDIRKTHDYKKVYNYGCIGDERVQVGPQWRHPHCPQFVYHPARNPCQPNSRQGQGASVGQHLYHRHSWPNLSIHLVSFLTHIDRGCGHHDARQNCLSCRHCQMCQCQHFPQQSIVRRYDDSKVESIRHRLSKFEFVLLLNKADAEDADLLMRMMKDFDSFLDQLAK